MRRFDGTIVGINTTATKLGPSCKYILVMYALTGCDSTSYPFNKGKTTGLIVLTKHKDLDLDMLFGEMETSKEEIINVGT